ncbi:MAG: BlaI/MecI/CopY family transcriptional regulator [Verrucomicrobiales bacterium]|jgi:BlaI family penicillinase repressor|nr:BlaI/MecI/CopY family transcriptional regulator [Verrucomicrobiales bacterium]
MKLPPRISAAEWEIMEVLWQRAPLTASEVVRELAGHTDWKDQTIRTMLGRLVRKQAVAYRADGKTYHYRPAVTRAQCVHTAGQSFVARMFDGATAAMLIHFVKNQPLTVSEIAELQAVLREKKKGV